MKQAFSRKNLWENLPPFLKGTVGRAAGLLPGAILLGGKYRQWEKFVAQADGWDSAQIFDYQLEQLRSICMLAYSRSPYYRASFDAANFDPLKLNGLEDFEKLPFINKYVINQKRATLLTATKTGVGMDYVGTGGSTGKPLG